MANYSCTTHTLPTEQRDIVLTICTSDDYMNVYATLTHEDPNQGYTTNFTATLQRENNYDAWAEDVMTKSGKLTSRNGITNPVNLTFGNIAKTGRAVRVKVKTDRGTYYSNIWIR